MARSLTAKQRAIAAKLGIPVPPARKAGRPYVVIANDVVEKMIEMEAMRIPVRDVCSFVGHSLKTIRDLRRDPWYQEAVFAKRAQIEEFLRQHRRYS